MRSELRKEMIRVLEELVDGKLDFVDLPITASYLRVQAVELLEEINALTEETKSSYRITIKGFDYYQKLKSPRLYWIKKNWFPVAVLVVTSMVTIGSTVIVVRFG